MVKSKLCFCVLLAFFGTTISAHSDATHIENKSCKELAVETEAYLDRAPFEDVDMFLADSPVWITLTTLMKELDRQSFYRLLQPVAEDFEVACIKPSDDLLVKMSERGLPANPSVSEVFDSIIEQYGLSRSLPNWGLIEVPEVNFETQTNRQLVQIILDLPLEERPKTQNNPFVFGFFMYLQKYNLRTKEEREKASTLMRLASYEGNTAPPDEPIAKLLDRLALEMGLRLR